MINQAELYTLGLWQRCPLVSNLHPPDVTVVCAASAGGGPVADGGGVCPSADAEEAGVPQRRGPQAAGPADGSGRPAVPRALPGLGEEQLFSRQ